MTDRLDRLERHLDEVLAGPRRLMRSLSKTTQTTGTDAMTDPNEYAHPTIGTEPRYDAYKELYAHVESSGGLTKREVFAMAAMQGMCAAGEYWDGTKQTLAANAVQYADDLIAELNKETP